MNWPRGLLGSQKQIGEIERDQLTGRISPTRIDVPVKRPIQRLGFIRAQILLGRIKRPSSCGRRALRCRLGSGTEEKTGL